MRAPKTPIVYPVEWQILRGDTCLSIIACPDETTAQMLGQFRHGVGISVRLHRRLELVHS